MTTGEKIAALRRRKNITQEQLAAQMSVSRQSVSRWEMDAALPETEKLVRLSRLLDCSIDYLLCGGENAQSDTGHAVSMHDCMQFIRECGYFFLATCAQSRPRLRPMGMIWADDGALYIATDKRKSLWRDLEQNAHIELAGYNLSTRRWLRLSGRAVQEHSAHIRDEMMLAYPMITQEYTHEDEINFVIVKILAENVSLN